MISQWLSVVRELCRSGAQIRGCWIDSSVSKMPFTLYTVYTVQIWKRSSRRGLERTRIYLGCDVKHKKTAPLGDKTINCSNAYNGRHVSILALVIFMGLCNLHRIPDYWRTSEPHSLQFLKSVWSQVSAYLQSLAHEWPGTEHATVRPPGENKADVWADSSGL